MISILPYLPYLSLTTINSPTDPTHQPALSAPSPLIPHRRRIARPDQTNPNSSPSKTNIHKNNPSLSPHLISKRVILPCPGPLGPPTLVSPTQPEWWRLVLARSVVRLRFEMIYRGPRQRVTLARSCARRLVRYVCRYSTVEYSTVQCSIVQ